MGEVKEMSINYYLEEFFCKWEQRNRARGLGRYAHKDHPMEREKW